MTMRSKRPRPKAHGTPPGARTLGKPSAGPSDNAEGRLAMRKGEEGREQLLTLLYSAIDSLNKELSGSTRLEKSPRTILYGEGGVLESLDLVRLVVLFERKVTAAIGRAVSITDDRALSQRRSPFRSVSS